VGVWEFTPDLRPGLLSAVPDGTLSRRGARRYWRAETEIAEDSLSGRCWVSTGMGSLDCT